MEEINELRNNLQEIILNNSFRENTDEVRQDIYYQILDLFNKYGLGDLRFGVMPMQLAIERYSNYIPINYEEIINKIYIGPIPDAPLKDRLAWKYLMQTND